MKKKSVSRFGGSFFKVFFVGFAWFLAAAQGQSACAPAPSGLVAWWPGEGDGTDIAGTNNGVLHNEVGFVPGEVNRAFSFDGISSYVEVPDSPSLRMTNEVTIEFWVSRQRMNFSYGECILEKGGDWTRGGLNYEAALHIPAYNNCLVFLFAGGWRGGGSVADTNWHHCAIVARQGDVDPAFYIDGVSQPVTYRDGASTIDLVTSPAPLHIGAQPDWPYWSKTLVDELSIYTRALSASEIQAIYNAGAAGKCAAPVGPTITSQPLSQNVTAGDTATFTVQVSGTQPFTFQWQQDGAAIESATSSSLVLTNVDRSSAGAYSVIVSNSVGWALSSYAALTVVPRLPAPPCAPVPSGIVGWWQGEGAATDIVGTNNGTFYGGVGFTNGVVNRAFSFDGNGSYFEVPDSPSLRVTTEVTIEFWVSRQRLNFSYGECILEKGGDWTRGGLNYEAALHIPAYNNCLVFLFAGGWRGGGSVADMNWHHCAIVARQGDTDPLFYIDGASQPVTYRDGASTINLVTSPAPLHIGAQPDWPYWSKTLVDEVSIYNRALSASEIQSIYSAGSGGKCYTPTAPAIVSQPRDQAAFAGGNATFSIIAAGTPPLSYQWVFNSNAISFATGPTLTLSSVTLDQAGQYAVVVTNAYGSVTSSVATLSVTVQAPFIVTQPQDQTVVVGSNATFSVIAGGSPSLSYQWGFNGSPIATGTNSALTLTGVSIDQAGIYTAVVTNAGGSITSSNANLVVNFPPALVQALSAVATAGGPAVVPIVLVANGNENALAFSLNFNPTLLSYSSIVAEPGVSLLINDSQVASGKLGAALALGAGLVFTPGTQQVAVVTFATPVETNVVTTPISFGDGPLGRQLADGSGHLLAALYAAGTVTLPAADLEGDVFPRPNGDRNVDISDWVLVGRYVAGLDSPTNSSEFQKADCAPRAILGDGQLTVIDWVQAGRYAARLDPPTAVGGPSGPTAGPVVSHPKDTSRKLIVTDATLVQGQSGTVSVDLTAQGNETALGFSLSFDASQLTYQSATLGNLDSTATLLVNASRAASGQVGLLLGLSSGAFAAGTDQVVRVTFQAAPAASATYAVSLTDTPVVRQVSDSMASPLSTTYLNGSITVNPLPSLNIVNADQSVTLSWPVWASNFVLESFGASLSPSAVWTNIPVTVTSTPTNNQVTVPMGGVEQYYRLRQQ